MGTQPSGWRVFDAQLPVLTYEHSFGPGTANALAVRVDGGVMVVSPPCGVSDGAYAALAAYGPVRALVAPNAFHRLGLAAWHTHFPQATMFAPAQSIARVQRRTGVAGIRPVYKTGEAPVRIRMRTTRCSLSSIAPRKRPLSARESSGSDGLVYDAATHDPSTSSL